MGVVCDGSSLWWEWFVMGVVCDGSDLWGVVWLGFISSEIPKGRIRLYFLYQNGICEEQKYDD